MAGVFEPYYEIVSHISRNGTSLITGAALAVLGRRFMTGARAKRSAWTVGAAYFIAAVVFIYMPLEVYSYTAHLSCFLIAYLALYRLEKENAKAWFFLCFTFFTIRWLADSVAYQLSYGLEIPLEEWILTRFRIAQKDMGAVMFSSFCAFRVVEKMWFILILSGVCRGFAKLCFFNWKEMEKKEWFLLMIPSITGVICYVWSGRSASAFLEETGRYLDDMDPVYRPMGFVMQALLLSAIMAMLWLYQKLKQEQGKRQSDRLLQQEIRNMRAHIHEVERLHEDLRGMRHDMKNHISVLQRLLEREAFGQAQEYLNSMGHAYAGMSMQGGRSESAKEWVQGGRSESAGEWMRDGKDGAPGEIGGAAPCPREEELRTGNPVADVILAEHQRRINDAGALLEAEFHYPDKTSADAFDLSIILDNALTNALEAVPRGGVIRLRSFREHHAYLIVVENSFEGELAPKSAEGIPKTTKQPAEAHGFGLRHIKAVAERYHGAVTIEQEGGMVRLNVMLCI